MATKKEETADVLADVKPAVEAAVKEALEFKAPPLQSEDRAEEYIELANESVSRPDLGEEAMVADAAATKLALGAAKENPAAAAATIVEKEKEKARKAALYDEMIEAQTKQVEEANAAAEKAAKSIKPKAIEDLKSTDTVVISFKVPVAVNEDGELVVQKEASRQHLKYQFWLDIPKDAAGRPIQQTLRGAELIGYVEDGTEVSFK